ncbi:MAG: DUF6151 family protein [Pseudomonadota bacterium]
MDLAFSCRCGAMTVTVADVSPKTGTHVHCYCTDCQTAATYLGHDDEVLDEKGGTEVFQFVPFRLSVTSGADQIGLIQLKRGGLMRWVASCCNTPMFNSSASPGVPIMGIVNPSVRAADPAAAKAAMGPSIGAFCPEEGWAPVDRPKVTLFRMIGRALLRAARPMFAGKTKDHALFRADKSPVAEARVLSEDEVGTVHASLGQKKAAFLASQP